jgi:hypothetical protein
MVMPLANPSALKSRKSSVATAACPGRATRGDPSRPSTKWMAVGTTKRKNDQKSAIWTSVTATWREGGLGRASPDNS